MTLTQLAAAAGVSKAAISKAAKAGRIEHAVNADGSFDFHPGNRTVQAYLNRRPQDRPSGLARDSAPKPPAQPKPKRDVTRDTPPESTAPRYLPETPPASDDEMALKDQLDAERVEKLRIENAAARKELIPRVTLERFLAKLWSVHTSTILPAGQRLAPTVAAHLGVTSPEAELKAQEVIDDTLYSAMAQIERKIQDFLGGLDE